MLKLKFSTKTSIVLIYLINLAFAAVSIFITIGDNKIASYIYIALIVLLLFVVIRTDILFEHKKIKEKK